MKISILHYSAPPVIGGVEAVIAAHTRQFLRAGYPVAVVAGRGDQAALPHGARLICIPEMDTRHPAIMEISTSLEQGQVPGNFNTLVESLTWALTPILNGTDIAIVHNVFTKHFNLPLTTALIRLIDSDCGCRWIAWCHDISWTSPNSRSKVHEGEPWDYLRCKHPGVLPVAVSRQRQIELAGLYQEPAEEIPVIYNGVDPESLLGLSQPGMNLIERMDLARGDLILLMPVRVTQAKNIELALQVTAALKQLGINPRLVVTGPPDPHDEHILGYFRQLKTLRAELGIENEAFFAFELGDEARTDRLLEADQVGELYRMSDVMFMPSHREGFGMPVLEAGMAGLQVFSTEVPAAREIGGEDVIYFAPESQPEQVASLLMDWADKDRVHHLRRRLRQEYTWQAIFRRSIEPLLQRETST